jgi:hypothetical protein
LICDGGNIRLRSASGEIWSSGRIGPSQWSDAEYVTTASAGCWFLFSPPQSFVTPPGADANVSVDATIYLTLLDGPRTFTVPADGNRVSIPGLGRCVADNPLIPANQRSAFTRLVCEGAFQPPRLLRDVEGLRSAQSTRTYVPFPAALSIRPVRLDHWVMRRADSATISVFEPFSHVVVQAETATVELHQMGLPRRAAAR